MLVIACPLVIAWPLVLTGAALAVWPANAQRVRLAALRSAGRIGPRIGEPALRGWSLSPPGRWVRLWATLRMARRSALGVPGTAAVAVMAGTVVGAALGGVVSIGVVSGATGAAGLTEGLPLGLAGGVGAATAALLGSAWADRRRRAAVDRDLDTAIGLLASELDAGAAPDDAWAAAATSSAILPSDPAGLLLDGAGSWTGLPDALRPVAITWQAAATTGAPLARLRGQVRADLLDGRETRRHVESALAGPRASASLLAVLPLLGIGLGAAMGAHPAAVLLGSSLGRWLLCLGVVLDCLGVLWTEALVRRAWPR